MKALVLIWLRAFAALGAAALFVAFVQQVYGADANLSAAQYTGSVSRGI